MKTTSIIAIALVAYEGALAEDVFEPRFLQDETTPEPTPEPEPAPKLTCVDTAQEPGDNCYFRSKAWYAKGREEKLAEAWASLVNEDEEDTGPEDFHWKQFPKFFTQKAGASFKFKSDEMPNKRLKITHTQGVVGKVRWVSEKDQEINPYTGILRVGSHTGLMRLSQATILHDLSDGLTPSFAMKFFIDGDGDPE